MNGREHLKKAEPRRAVSTRKQDGFGVTGRKKIDALATACPGADWVDVRPEDHQELIGLLDRELRACDQLR
jgi:hypothetical protein